MKYLQARYILAAYGYAIEQFRSSAPYEEDYSRGKDGLLAAAIRQVSLEVGRDVLFFVEDTSLRIEALSGEAEDVPGLAVKEWFQGFSFATLEGQLRSAGGDRGATVKSGIALHVPGRTRPVYFYGETRGQIALTPPEFDGSPVHPWLGPASFDGWFLPDGTTKRLGQMTAEESTRFHFRARALRHLAERLDEYTSILNLPGSAYLVRHRPPAGSQLPLFEEPSRRLVVCGPRAAGKTTLGEYSAVFAGAEHFEASRIVRLLLREQTSEYKDLSAFADLLHSRHGDDVIVRMLAEEHGLLEAPFSVITGLRKFAELVYLRQAGVRYLLVYVEAGPQTRYARYVQRAREDAALTFDEFLREDEALAPFLRYVRDYADVVMQNESDLSHFLAQVRHVLRPADYPRPKGLATARQRSERKRLLLQALGILVLAGTPLSAFEIREALAAQGTAVRCERIARVLRKLPGVCRITPKGASGPTYEALFPAKQFLQLALQDGRAQFEAQP